VTLLHDFCAYFTPVSLSFRLFPALVPCVPHALTSRLEVLRLRPPVSRSALPAIPAHLTFFTPKDWRGTTGKRILPQN
jgi:hypothetical protein